MADPVGIKITYGSSLNEITFWSIGEADMNLGSVIAHDVFPLPFLNVVSIFVLPAGVGVEIPLTSGHSITFKCKKLADIAPDEQAVCRVFGEDIPAELTTDYECAEWVCEKLQKRWGLTTTDPDPDPL